MTTARRYARPAAIAALAALATAAAIGIPTDVVPNPWFARKVPVDAFDVSTLVMLSALTGALVATYAVAGGSPAAARRGGIGSGLLGWFAISCPACNKIVIALIGTSGATGAFAAVQPVLGAAAVALAAVALSIRVRAIRRGDCPLPDAPPAVRIGATKFGDG